MRRATKIIVAGLVFGVAVFTAITLTSGSPQLGLHGGFWITLVFCCWLEWRLPS
ncbi:MAG: hypothetical protein Q8N26_37035 [Myxococcales bacterium]|nr:hypothetical protein [Myxococcales bacterium]